MRLVALALLLAACASKPEVDPQLEKDALYFCRAWEDHGRPKMISGMSKELSIRIKSPQLLSAFAAITPDGIGLDRIRAVITSAGVFHCPTLDWLESRAHAPHD